MAHKQTVCAASYGPCVTLSCALQMFGHVSECDYPEDLPTYTAWLQQQQQQSPLGIQVLCEKDKLYKALAVQLPAAS